MEDTEYICKEVPEGFGCSVRTGYEKVKVLVRCKNCKWRNTNACFCKAPKDVMDDWFCSEGELNRSIGSL